MPNAPDHLHRYPALAEMQAVPLFSSLNYQFTDAGEGWAEITFTASPAANNLYGIVHGGVWLVLADSAMGGALATLASPDERILTAQSDFRWLRPLDGATIRTRATVLRRGRTLSHCEARLYDTTDRQIAHATATYLILPPE